MADEKPILEETKHIGNMIVMGNGEFVPKSGSRIAQEFIITMADNKQYLAVVNRNTYVHTYDGLHVGPEVENPPKEILDFIAEQKKNFDNFVKRHK